MKLLYLALVIGLVTVLVLEGFYLSLVNPTFRQVLSVFPSVNKPSPNVITPGQSWQKLKPGMTVIYQAESDTEGRTLIYSYQNPQDQDNWAFSGMGSVKRYPSKPYIVGLFQSSENLANSSDFYLYLVMNTLRGTLLLPKVRLALQPLSGLETRFGIENLNNPGQIDVKSITTLNKLGGKFNEMLKPGDAVVIFPFFDKTKNSIVQDENQVPVAQWIVVRRFL